jgi:hypothetical protein
MTIQFRWKSRAREARGRVELACGTPNLQGEWLNGAQPFNARGNGGQTTLSNPGYGTLLRGGVSGWSSWLNGVLTSGKLLVTGDVTITSSWSE